MQKALSVSTVRDPWSVPLPPCVCTYLPACLPVYIQSASGVFQLFLPLASRDSPWETLARMLASQENFGQKPNVT